MVDNPDPSYFKGADLPVEGVSWYDAVEYCNARSAAEGLDAVYTIDSTNVTMDKTKNGYRLPTEAEWEYAARAGTSEIYNTGENTITTEQANFYDSGIRKTTAVGSYAPNAWGLYDMHGNVWEWVWDRYGAYKNTDTLSEDPDGAVSSAIRVIRGGSWDFSARDLRSAFRGYGYPLGMGGNLGFRVVCR
jgi:formylglycine-generating enzyme required for sulfatase activity